MFDRKRARDGRVARATGSARGGSASRRATAPRVEALEGRELLAATIVPIATVTAPTTTGYQLPVEGGLTNQTYTVTSDNPLVKATVTQGEFLTLTVTHASSGAGDPAFTGTMTFQLFDDLTPLTTSRIEELVEQGFYNGNTFHRIASGFPTSSDYIVQGGSEDKTGGGTVTQAGFPYNDEYVQQLVYSGTGQLAIANAGPNTNSSQFFITTGSPQFLDYTKTIFGQIVSGQSTLEEIAHVPTDSSTNAPLDTVTIDTATLSNVNPNGVIHIDTSQAPAGSVAHLTITGTETATGDTTSTVATVDVGPNVDENGTPLVLQPYLNMIPNFTVGTSQTLTYQLPSVNVSNAPILYTVQGGVTTDSSGNATFSPVNTSDVTATVNQFGVLTVTPVAGLAAGTTVTLLAGVGLQNPTSGDNTAVSNFDYYTFTVTFNGNDVSLAPIANVGGSDVTVNTPTNLQLNGTVGTPGQTLTYTIQNMPTNGTITNFDASTGSFTYTSNNNYLGADQLTYVVTSNDGQTSLPATFFLLSQGGNTNAVRVVGTTLIVTPPPRTDGGTNTINVTQVNGNLQTSVNGIIDITDPASSGIDNIIVYGTKASDDITIDPSVTQPVYLNGGQGGKNVLQAGSGDSTQLGFLGQNTEVAGSGNNELTGQAGHVTFKAGTSTTASTNILYAAALTRRGDIHGVNYPGIRYHQSTKRHEANPPSGTFYTFNSNGKVVKVATPKGKGIIEKDNYGPYVGEGTLQGAGLVNNGPSASASQMGASGTTTTSGSSSSSSSNTSGGSRAERHGEQHRVVNPGRAVPDFRICVNSSWNLGSRHRSIRLHRGPGVDPRARRARPERPRRAIDPIATIPHGLDPKESPSIIGDERGRFTPHSASPDRPNPVLRRRSRRPASVRSGDRPGAARRARDGPPAGALWSPSPASPWPRPPPGPSRPRRAWRCWPAWARSNAGSSISGPSPDP